MQRWSIDSSPERTILRPTRWGRARGGLSTFVLVLAIVLAALAVFFVPDFVREVPDQREGYTGFFVVFLAGTSLLVATIAAIMKTLSRWTWTFDWAHGVVRLSTRTTMGHHFDDELDLDRLREVSLSASSSLLGSHELALELDDAGANATRVIVLSTRTSLAELREIQQSLERSHRSAVP